MTSLITIKDKLKTKIKFQETPIVLVDADFISFTVEGAQRLYVDAGLDSWNEDYTESTSQLNRTFDLTELEYILVASQIAFFNQIKNFWDTLASYTTNAISVTGTRDIYKSINGNVTELESRLAKLAFKFTHKSTS